MCKKLSQKCSAYNYELFETNYVEKMEIIYQPLLRAFVVLKEKTFASYFSPKMSFQCSNLCMRGKGHIAYAN